MGFGVWGLGFGVDRHHIALASLDVLAAEGTIDRALCAQAIKRYEIDAAVPAPWTR